MKLFKLLFLFMFLISSVYATEDPTGYWKTIDDSSHQPKSIVYIWRDHDQLRGKVVMIFPKPGEDQNKLCTACRGAEKNHTIVGMVILNGLKEKSAKWDGGKIMDPENGKSYSCSVKLNSDGDKLEVRGYIGLPILGRTQVWERTTYMN